MLGKIAGATCFATIISLGVGAWSYAPSSDKKPWRPQSTATNVAMPAEQLPAPKAKAKQIPLVLIGQGSAAKTAVASR